MSAPSQAQLLYVHEAAKILNISARMMHRVIAAGLVPVLKTSQGYTLIHPNDLRGLELTEREILNSIRQKKQQQSATSQGENSNEHHPSKT